MKKLLVIMAMVVAVIAMSFETNAENGVETSWKKVEISGFGSKETAVKGPVKTGLDNLAQEIEKQISGKKAELFFNIEGLADRTGVVAENDKIGKERADNASAYLSKYFPNAKFSSFSSGDSQNERLVVVSHQIKWPVPVETRSNSGIIILGISIFIVIAIIVTLFVWHKFHKELKEKEKAPEKLEENEFWPADLDELAKVINNKSLFGEELLCPFCEAILREQESVGHAWQLIKWENLKRHLFTKGKCLKDSQRKELSEKNRQQAVGG
jgi:hypothetical protein